MKAKWGLKREEMKDQRNLSPTLLNLFERKEIALAWSLEGHQFKQVNLVAQKISKDYLTFSFNEIQRPFLDPLISIDRKIKIHFPDEGLFALCSVKEISSSKITLSHPILHEFEDRRKIERKNLENQLNALFVIEKKQVLRKNISDIGSGGFSIILMKSESNPFKRIKNADVEIEDIGLKAKVELVAEDKMEPFKWEDTPYGGTRLSFKFSDADDRFKAILDVFLARYQNAGL